MHPSPGVFDPSLLFAYESALRGALLPEYRPGMVLSLVVQPSFATSYLIFLEANDLDGEPTLYRVVLRRERDSSWEEMMNEMHRQQGGAFHLGESEQQAALSRMKIANDEIVATLDGATGRLIRSAWEGVVARTQYPREVLTAPDGTGVAIGKADGTEYYFWASGQSGVTHSPEGGTLLSDFVQLGETLGAFVSTPGPQRTSVQRTLAERARSLVVRIARNESCVKPYEPLSDSMGPVGAGRVAVPNVE